MIGISITAWLIGVGGDLPRRLLHPAHMLALAFGQSFYFNRAGLFVHRGQLLFLIISSEDGNRYG